MTDPLVGLFLLIATAATGSLFIAFVACYGLYADWYREQLDDISILAATLLMLMSCTSWALTRWMFSEWVALAHMRMF